MINLRNLFRRNLPVKILALIAAIIMWGYVMNEENPSVNGRYTVPIEIVNAPEGYDVDLAVKEVTMKVRAPRALMATAHESDFKAVIDLSGATEGEYDEKIKTVIPQGFELQGLSDDTVHVIMEALIAHGVPVDISVSGKAAQGMELADIKPSQQYVNVYGPRHLVDSIAKASGKIRLADNNSDFTMRVKMTAITADGEGISNLSVLPGELDVTVHLVPGEGKKIVTIKPAVTGILPEGYTLGEVTVQPTQVEISGSNKLLADLKSIDTQAVSLQGVTTTLDKDVELALPEGIASTIKKVTLHIDIKNNKNNQNNQKNIGDKQ